jgi:hypothetical protein
MQKVVYVLLQQHAERYWQADHDDESDEDEIDGNNTGIYSCFSFLTSFFFINLLIYDFLNLLLYP